MVDVLVLRNWVRWVWLQPSRSSWFSVAPSFLFRFGSPQPSCPSRHVLEFAFSTWSTFWFLETGGDGLDSGLHARLGFHGCSPFVDFCCLSRASFVLRLRSAVESYRFLRCPGSELLVPLNGFSTGLHVRPGLHGRSPFIDFCCLSRASFVLRLRSAVESCRFLRCPGSELVAPVNGHSTGLHVRPGLHGCSPFVDFVASPCPSELVVRLNGFSTGLHVRLGFHGALLSCWIWSFAST
jgi:hypothetical protein